jgi:hypothetical protein
MSEDTAFGPLSKLYFRFDLRTQPMRTSNTVPLPILPPFDAVPHKMFPDKTKPACGFAPSLLVAAGKAGVPVKFIAR